MVVVLSQARCDKDACPQIILLFGLDLILSKPTVPENIGLASAVATLDPARRFGDERSRVHTEQRSRRAIPTSVRTCARRARSQWNGM